MSEVFMDYGHKMIIVKELSTQQEMFDEIYLVDKINIKIVTYFFVLLILLGYGSTSNFWGYNPIVMVFVSLSGFFLSLSNVLVSIFHSYNKYILETISLLVFSIFLGLSLILSRIMVSEVSFLFGYMVGAFMMFYVSYILLTRSIKKISVIKLLNNMTFAGLKKELIVVLPFSSIVIVEAVFGNFDTILVENYCSQIDLGIFSGVKKIIAGLSILMLVCASALMPLLSRMSKSNLFQTKIKIVGLFGIVTFLGATIFFFYYLFNEQIVNLLLGDKFSIITEWDTQIGIICLASYIRIVPGIYFITADRENIRLFITAMALFIGSIFLVTTLPGLDVKYAVRAITRIHIFTTIAYVVIFIIVLFFSRERNTIEST